MDLKPLRYLIAAIEERSIQRAAVKLNMTQPALSRRLRDLEAELGCRLLDRGPQGVTPTQEGVTLYRRALSILDEVDIATLEVRRLASANARAPRLGLVQTSRKYGFLQTAITAFRAEAPAAPIEFNWGMSADLVAALSEGRLDMTLAYRQPGGIPHFHERLIHREQFILAVHPAHRLAGHGSIDLADLAGEPIIWLSRRADAGNHDDLLQKCRVNGFEPLISHLAGSHVEQIDLAIVNTGICLAPSTTLLTVPSGMLMFRPLRNLNAELRLTFVWRTGPLGHETAKLLSCVHEAIDDHRRKISTAQAVWASLDGRRITLVD